ncbi:MAG: hypothetical protein KDJ23_05650 [Rhodoblastus sp.]|nr:hypothetical protein [Rhodoblastus sp.]
MRRPRCGAICTPSGAHWRGCQPYWHSYQRARPGAALAVVDKAALAQAAAIAVIVMVLIMMLSPICTTQIS